MNSELDQASHDLDEALILFAGGRTEDAYIRIHEARVILDILTAAVGVIDEPQHAEVAGGVAFGADCLNH
jgi:hypothetical protein